MEPKNSLMQSADCIREFGNSIMEFMYGIMEFSDAVMRSAVRTDVVPYPMLFLTVKATNTIKLIKVKMAMKMTNEMATWKSVFSRP